MPNVLAILPEGFEEIETVTPVDLLRRAGIEVLVAALGENRLVKGRTGITLQADTTLQQVGDTLYDCLFLPGGPGVKLLRADPRVRATVLHHHEKARWLAAICAAPTVLADAGLLQGRRFTAHFSVQSELPELLSAERVVSDGHIVTSRGAGTSVDFGLRLIEHLVNPPKAHEVASAICY